MKAMHMVTFLLLIVGGLNWGLTAFGYNVVDMLGSTISMIIYVLVGLAALYELFTHRKHCMICKGNPGMNMPQ